MRLISEDRAHFNNCKGRGFEVSEDSTRIEADKINLGKLGKYLSGDIAVFNKCAEWKSLRTFNISGTNIKGTLTGHLYVV